MCMYISIFLPGGRVKYSYWQQTASYVVGTGDKSFDDWPLLEAAVPDHFGLTQTVGHGLSFVKVMVCRTSITTFKPPTK